MENVGNTTLETGNQEAHASGPRNSNPRPNRGRRPPHAKKEPFTDAFASYRRPRYPKGDAANPSNAPLNEEKTPSTHKGPRRKPPNNVDASAGQGPSSSSAMQKGATSSLPREGPSWRRANFGGSLTKPDGDEDDPSLSMTMTTQQTNSHPPGHHHHHQQQQHHHHAERRRGKNARPWLPKGDDLASSLIRDLSSPPYPDCPICFSPIRPEQPIWSCSPSVPIVVSNEAQVREYCWSSFHLRCVRPWAEKSVREVAEAWRARGDLERKGDWRCPGCQAKRELVPSAYWCFCHLIPDPKPPRLSTPHSCGASCSRPRESGCGHPCPLQCHPGPCPPCKITIKETCYCRRKLPLTFGCGADGRGKARALRDLSCGNVCEQTLNCGKHTCQRRCHDGACDPCDVTERARCWCGKEEQQVLCGVGEGAQCFLEGEPPWIGRFPCVNVCGRFFDCRKHQCEKPCHPPSSSLSSSSEPASCPRSPSKITRCPCGTRTIAPTTSQNGPEYDFPARLDCSDPVPTCDSVCSKPHPGCEHACESKCHHGPCPPCAVEIVRPCRCGATTRRLPCHAVNSGSSGTREEILCDKPCQALRACGRHQCRRVCCSLASFAAITGRKGKKRAVAGGIVDEASLGIGEERGGLHECDLPCGKMLTCGNHRCELKDHKGPCLSCLRSSFEDLVCPCGRTVYEPPIPCGTRVECTYLCPLPRTTCEHQNIEHQCHDDSVPCPPCPHLMDKLCACGKKVVSNIRCSLETEKVSCGTPCGKLMSCGFHHCERLCHNDPCGPCSAQCGKSRKSCLPNKHPCIRPCHAPSSCPETEACQALVTLTCPCGRIKQSVSCGRTASSTRTSQSNIKCTNDCQIAKRNARLAEALGINTEAREKTAGMTVAYGDDLASFARLNAKFLAVVEKAFSDFVLSEKRIQVLPHMTVERRKFVHDLASIYRMDTQMVDQEPHRSVQLLRRIDTRIPTPLLSTHITTTAPPPSLGKLANLRTIRGGANITGPAPVALPPSSSATTTTTITSTTTTTSKKSGDGISWRFGDDGGNLMPPPRGWASVTAKALPPPPPASSAAVVVVKSQSSNIRSSTTPLPDVQLRNLATGSRTPSNDVYKDSEVRVGHVPDDWEEDP